MFQMMVQMQANMVSLTDCVEIVNRKLDRVLANQITSDTGDQNPDYNGILGLLPLKSLEDFNSFERKLAEDRNFKNHLVNVFACTGGRDARNCIMDVMRRLMTDSLAEEFSYSGKVRNSEPKKIGFCEKIVCCVVNAAVQKLFKEEATEDVIKNALCSWLQQAKSRRTRRDQRVQKKDVVER